jgi:long-chain acyl-CoA synthetase
MVVGQDQKHLGVLIVPSLDGFASAGITVSDLSSLKGRPEANALLRSEIRQLVGVAAGFKPFERIAAVEIIEKPFEVGDELTMTFKLKRHVIAEKYIKVIKAMFAG